MQNIKYYYDLLSPACRSIMLLLKAENILFKGVSISNKDYLINDYKHLNPLKTLPFIIDNNFKLTECSAILKYLFCKYQLPNHWYPQEFKKQSKIDEYISWHNYNTGLHCQMYYDHKVSFQPVDYHALNKWKNLTENTLDQLEYYWLPMLNNINSKDLKDPENVHGISENCYTNNMGIEINLAHLLISCSLMQPYVAGWDVVTQDRPILVQFFANLKQQLAKIRNQSTNLDVPFKENNKYEVETTNQERDDIFYSVHKEALDLRN
ncbi:unnamed protein product, partial [Gordionus sp. m RMFG-2023]